MRAGSFSQHLFSLQTPLKIICTRKTCSHCPFHSSVIFGLLLQESCLRLSCNQKAFNSQYCLESFLVYYPFSLTSSSTSLFSLQLFFSPLSGMPRSLLSVRKCVISCFSFYQVKTVYTFGKDVTR